MSRCLRAVQSRCRLPGARSLSGRPCSQRLFSTDVYTSGGTRDAYRNNLPASAQAGELKEGEKAFFPRSGVAYMDGIRNFNEEVPHSAFKPETQVTLAEAKAQGFEVHRPVREYYLPPHWKFGRSHLLLTLEFDCLHIWARPPDGKPFPPSPLAALSEDEQREKWPFFVPPLQKMTYYEDDWIITDVHTFWTDSPIYVVPAYERFLNTKFRKEGTPEYDALVTDLDRAEMVEDKNGWVGKQFFRNYCNFQADRDLSKGDFDDMESSDSDSDSSSEDEEVLAQQLNETLDNFEKEADKEAEEAEEPDKK